MATCSNEAVDGRWRATITVATPSTSFDVPLEFSTGAVGLVEDRSEVEGRPTIYAFTDLQGRQLQVYAGPDEPGPWELDLTLFDASGTEMPVTGIVAIGVAPVPRFAGNRTRLRRIGMAVALVGFFGSMFGSDLVEPEQREAERTPTVEPGRHELEAEYVASDHAPFCERVCP